MSEPLTAPPCAIDAGFSRNSGFWARRIMSVTESHWCHCFIRFRFQDGPARIFESRFQTGGFVESRPESYDLADSGAHRQPRLEAVCFVPLQTGPTPEIVNAFLLCLQWQGAKSYPLFQLASIWLAHRYGIPVPQSKDALICSEALAVIANEIGLDLRDRWHPTFDSVTPGSAWNNLMAVKAGYGDQVVKRQEAKICGVGYSKYYSLWPRRP
jgi:hypothetical protein